MSHPSEEQPKPVGTCPICDAELILIEGKIRWHECIPDGIDLQQLAKDIVGLKT